MEGNVSGDTPLCPDFAANAAKTGKCRAPKLPITPDIAATSGGQLSPTLRAIIWPPEVPCARLGGATVHGSAASLR